MNLILWRHAEAEDAADDMARALTSKGRKQAARMARWLHAHLPESALILSSPAVRAQQTAMALAELGHRRMKLVAALAPDLSALDAIEAAEWPERKGAVVVVGHQPTLGRVAARLLCGDERDWSIKKGAIWWLQARNGGGEVQLRTVVAPDQL